MDFAAACEVEPPDAESLSLELVAVLSSLLFSSLAAVAVLPEAAAEVEAATSGDPVVNGAEAAVGAGCCTGAYAPLPLSLSLLI